MSVSTTFQRSLHDKENPFAQISRSLIRDERLSPECRWMLIYFLSMKDGWVIQMKQLCNHLKPHMGKTRVYRLVDEAIHAGYMKKEVTREGNLIRGIKYFVSEDASFSNNFSDIPEMRMPEMKIPKTETIKENIGEEEHKEETLPPNPQKGGAPKGACYLLPFGKFVFLLKSDYEKFCLDHSQATIDGLIEEINDYLASSGKKPYKDYAAALRQWIRRRKQQDPKLSPIPSSTPSAKVAQDRAELEQANRELGKKIHNKYFKLVKVNLINTSSANYIEFNMGEKIGNVTLYFSSATFREQCLTFLRKLDQDTTGL